MHNKHKKQLVLKPCYILLYSLFLFFTIGSAYAQNITIREIPDQDKLPINTIHLTFQDSEGYIWYATQDGLCRYDGYNIRVFRSNYKTPGILMNNKINAIAEDREKKIWFGTPQGAYILDKSSYTIVPVNYPELSKKDISYINTTQDGTIWISVEGWLYLFTPDNTFLKKYEMTHKGFPQYLSFLIEDPKDGIIVCKSWGGGLYRLNPLSDTFEPYHPHPDYTLNTCFVKDAKYGYYWLGNWREGIVRFDPHSESEESRFKKFPLVGSDGNNAACFQIIQDDIYGYIWVITWDDLLVFRINENAELEEIDISSLLPKKKRVLNDIIKDNKGNLWVSSFDKESLIIEFSNQPVAKYSMKGLERKEQTKPAIVALCQDEDDIFWVSQARLGLCLYDAKIDKLKTYKECEQTKDIRVYDVPLILKSHEPGLVWVMQHETQVFGLNQQDLDMKLIHHIDLKEYVNNPGSLTTIYEDKKENLWIGTTKGLFVYNSVRRQLDVVNEISGNIADLTETPDGRIWIIVKDKGLYAIEQKQITREYPFRKHFQCIDKSKNEESFWIGTNDGEVLSFDIPNETWEDFTTACGMNGDRINNILLDKYENVWIMTSQYVKKIAPRLNAYQTYAVHEANFLLDRFLPNAVYYDQNESIYLGGISGFISITSTLYAGNELSHINTVISDVKIMGRSINESTDRNHKTAHAIIIYPDEQNIEIEFSSLDYHNITQVRYAYKLEGVDNDWVYLSEGKNTAFYNSLGKGSYTFQVKATDSNGRWSKEITTLQFRRLPAFYETWWAYMLYFLTALGLLYFVLRTMRNRLILQNKIQIKELEKQKNEELNHVKLQFFTNITHELLTPLSIISASIDELKQEEGNKEKYTPIINNTNRLIRLIQQILEFRKAESGNLRLKVSKGDLSSFIEKSIEAFVPLAKKQKMNIQTSLAENITGYFDADKLDKIIYNLLSNAIKYTPKEGLITIQTAYIPDSGLFRFSVNNPGEIISEEKRKHLFERFYEGDYRRFNTIGTGIGLSLVKDLVLLHQGSIKVDSMESEGNTFIVEIPVLRSAYTETDIEEDKEISHYNQPVLLENESIEITTTDENPNSSLVLLVEDNEELLASMCRFLNRKYRILTACNGVEALKILEKEEIDLIVSDVMMPEMDGIELCRSVKNKFETCHIPFILLTAKTSDEDRVTGYESGADGYISKPIRLPVLTAKIDNLLNRQKRLGVDFRKQLVFEAKELNYTSMDEVFMQKAVDCVNSHLDDAAFEVPQFISAMVMARTTLADKIKLLTGLTISGFINNIRLQAACRLLEEQKTVRVADLAYAVGFNDPKYFTTCFKKKFAMTPSEYKSQLDQSKKE